MDWKTATPYVAAGVALFVGLASAILSARNVRRTLEQQRALSREERLWEKRADAYVDLIAWSTEAMDAVAALWKTSDGIQVQAQEWIDATRVPPDLGARVGAFGSQEVDEQLDGVHKAAMRFRHLGPDQQGPAEGRRVSVARLRVLATFGDLQRSLGDLRDVIRAELQPDGPLQIVSPFVDPADPGQEVIGRPRESAPRYSARTSRSAQGVFVPANTQLSHARAAPQGSAARVLRLPLCISD